MSPNIQPEEKLYRAVFPHIIWDEETGRPSSALFKDKKGVSVDREGSRTLDSIIMSFKQTHGNEKLKGVVKVDASFCLALNLLLKYVPIPDNIYHSEIHGSDSRALISDGIAKKLSRNCEICYLT